LSVDTKKLTSRSSRQTIRQTALFAVALVSLSYALLTATKLGIDLHFFQQGAREWVDGIFRIGAGPIGEYPPFALPLLAPIVVRRHRIPPLGLSRRGVRRVSKEKTP